MSAWLAAAVVGLGTYVTRASFIVTLADRDLPPFVVRLMRNVAPAVLAALVASILVGDEGIGGLAQPVALASLASAALLAVRTRNLFYSLGTGMVVFWLLSWVF